MVGFCLFVCFFYFSNSGGPIGHKYYIIWKLQERCEDLNLSILKSYTKGFGLKDYFIFLQSSQVDIYSVTTYLYTFYSQKML